MKKTFVFDKCEDELLNIDENTVIIETGIDAQRVKESIMKEIKEGKREKRASVKKFFSIMAIAAAIAAATITAHATGVFNPAFSELFAGEPANGIFPGANISVISDTLDIEFLGVTGDEKDMVSIYEIRNKDGSSFVDTFNTDDDYRFMSVRAEADVTENKYRQLKEMVEGGACGRGGGVLYELADEKTIRAFALYNDDMGYIKGERLTVTDTETTIYHVDEIIYSDETDTFTQCFDFMKENEDFIKQKESELKENQTIIPLGEPNGVKLAVMSTKVIPLKYELAAVLNYKTIERTFPEARGREFTDLNTEWTIEDIKAGSFGITIEAATDNNRAFDGLDMENSSNWSAEESHEYFEILQSSELEIEITLNDGTRVYGVGSSSSSETEPDGKCKSSWSCSYFKDGEASKPFTLDPNNIVRIRCNDTELIG